jgi:hypothetical protein
MKIAVGTLRLAKRHLHVDPEWSHGRENFSTPVGSADIHSSGVKEDFYIQLAIPRAVKLAKENSLPAP